MFVHTFNKKKQFFFSLEYTKRICNELKKNNIEIDKENTELRKVEHNLKSDIEKLNSIFENEVSKLNF